MKLILILRSITSVYIHTQSFTATYSLKFQKLINGSILQANKHKVYFSGSDTLTQQTAASITMQRWQQVDKVQTLMKWIKEKQ